MVRTAIITGATGGIGSEFAKQLAEKKWNLILTGRNTTKLLLMQKELEKNYSIKVKTIVADLTISHDREMLITKLKKESRIDMLVNNAGFGVGNLFLNEKESWENMINLHITATVDLTREILPLILKQKKSYLINVASLAGFFPLKNSVIYSASKSFLISFSESLHLELSEKGLRVQVLCPGFTKTNFFANTQTKELAKNQSIASWMSPVDVVRKSLFDLEHKSIVICVPGWKNRFLKLIDWLIPRRLYYYILKHS